MSNALRLQSVAAPAPDSRRSTRLALVLFTVVAMIVVLATPSVAFAADTATQLRYACAQKSNGLLRVASSAGDCRTKQETPVTIWPGPTALCTQPDGSVRRFASAKSCMGAKPAGTLLVVPTTNGQPVYFCAPSSGVLRRVNASTVCLSTEQRYVIGNHAPSALTLSNDSLLENEPAATIVGTLGLVDEDPAATPAFALVSGAGSTDNAAFTVTGSTLKTAASFDFETKASYSIRVRGTDGYGGSLEQVFTISVLDVVEDVPPTAVADTATVDEDAAPTTVDVLVNDEDVDGGPISISGVGQPDHGTVVIADDEASVTYEPDAGYCNAPPGTTTDEFTYTLAPGGSTTTVGVKVTCVDDLPVAADDEATVDEDAAATAIDVLANDTDSDGGARSITSVVQPEYGTVVITGGGTGLTYQPDAEYCNAPPGDANDVFSYTLSPGDANAQVSVKVICIADAPVADDETFDGPDGAVGNTFLIVDDPSDGAIDLSRPHLLVAGNLLEGDTDADPGTELAIESGVTVTEQGGFVYLEADGDFAYLPPVGCNATADGFDYAVTDQGVVQALTDTGHVTIAISDCVWYVDNAADGNDGNGSKPFDTIAQAAAASSAGDDIFVFDGDGTSTGYSTAIVLDDDQQLIGEASDLVVGGRLLHQGDPAKRPTITASPGANVVSLGVGNRVAGLEVHPVTTGGGIRVSGPGGDATIDDVRIVDTGAGGIGLALQNATGTNTIGDLEVDVIGLGVVVNDTAKIVFDPAATVSIRTSGSGWAFLAQRSNLEGSQIDRIVVDDSFDSGVRLQQTTGVITFGDLDIRTLNSTQAAFSLVLTGPVTVPANATAKIVATNGPAVDVAASSGSSLSFDEVTSTKSSVYGINLDEIGAGTFSAAAGELSAGPFGSTPFRVRGGSGDISYGGSITDGPATTSVDIQSRTGGTVTLSGSITDGSDTGGGVVVANNTGGATVLSGPSKHLETGANPGVSFGSSNGHALSITGGGLDVTTTSGVPLAASLSGTIVVTGEGNTLSSTTGTGLSIVLTGIGADDVTFRRISSNGAPSGIVLLGTGTAGGLHVTGNGSTVQGGDASGGTIAAATGDGISLLSTADVSFRNMRVENSAGNGIGGVGVIGFSFLSGTVTGAGDADGEDGIAFDGSNANLSGAVDISNSVLTSNEASGISITNAGGTISSATISGNRISDAGDLLTPGAALLLQATGTTGGAATITKATISSNVITDFRAGHGIRLIGGNQAGAAKSTLGNPGSVTNVVAVTGNRMDGGSGGIEQQPETFVDVQVLGAGDANVDVSTNGTDAEPIRHLDCQAISLMTGGAANVTAKFDANVIAAGSRPGCSGISANATSLNTVGATLAARVTNNQVSATGGPGIFVGASGAGMATAKVTGNNVLAPTGDGYAGYAGIIVAAGSIAGPDSPVCVAITGNTTAGGTGVFQATGIQLSKLSTDPTINDFGIEGLPQGQTASPAVENYLNGLNTSASGSVGVGGTVLSTATSGFSSCTTGL
ncbi:cadherin repeat domain-containing protein [Agromyces fucosus]|uniref:Cadherin repeat domain-containing protein n=1 Tax=Agromyces fucosus TaxID=41985 RepID=A0A4Q2JQV6_9MICO|nr:Ig-like domain-containing protein [Agromyces fucosus]RXZ48640.1 cadherin repeat domain-containing protein [Agromyces fucosus]